MLETFLSRARADKPVYLCEVRKAFQAKGTRPFSIHATAYDGTVRRFPLLLPDTCSEEEAEFVASYVHAIVYNILSSLGAVSINLYLDRSDRQLCALADGLGGVFQTELPKAKRSGYGKCLNVNERTIAALLGENTRFSFHTFDRKQEPEVPEPASASGFGGAFFRLPAAAADKLAMGMDIGGTDVKLVTSVRGQLRVFKEFDWFPAAFGRAEQLIEPLLLLTRLMRAAASLCAAGREALLDKTALGKHATQEEMELGCVRMEAAAGDALRRFDAIGLCFPDVVIRNQVVGGETYKTRGMRENHRLDYERQFSKITNLTGQLQAYLVPGGTVMNTNDGPMAAFTTAVEQAAAGLDVSRGFFAHTLGTELGTGWVLPDGSIPEIPLEVYNFILDLGSFGQRAYPANDVRSVNNFNTGLPGTLQKIASQSGVFRLAAKLLPAAAPAVLQEAFDRGLFVREGDLILVPTVPADQRKPCLEFFMEQAARSGGAACAEIFRKIGESLGACFLETDYILRPETKERTLYGRLVKNPRCFALLCEGANRLVPQLRQYAADGNLANTTLMKQLASHPDYTVAQFAQAVGAVYYGCLPFVSH
ncbi:MAG: hypothetical protein VB055_09055 [Oscillospiraceae bacterium]|nr:hypothetical protein [Oscillospiraceae bacterium]